MKSTTGGRRARLFSRHWNGNEGVFHGVTSDVTATTAHHGALLDDVHDRRPARTSLQQGPCHRGGGVPPPLQQGPLTEVEVSCRPYGIASRAAAIRSSSCRSPMGTRPDSHWMSSPASSTRTRKDDSCFLRGQFPLQRRGGSHRSPGHRPSFCRLRGRSAISSNDNSSEYAHRART
jgi:hypothetical protein